MTNEEEVPRFSLRRGARFLETLRDEPESEAADERWLADLGQDESGADAVQFEDDVAADADEPEVVLPSPSDPAAPPGASAGESGGSNYKRKLEALTAAAFEPSSPPVDEVPQPLPQPDGGGDQPVHGAPDQEALGQAVSALAEHLAGLEEALARTAAACMVARTVLRQGQAQLDQPSSRTAGPTPEVDARRHSPENPAVSRLTTGLRRLESLTLRDLLHLQ